MIAKSDVGDILQKALDGSRLTADDGVRLLQSDDIHTIGAAADAVRRKMNGDRTYYIVNRHINYTDICVNRCRFCAYSREAESPEAYAMSVSDIVDEAVRQYEGWKYTELHIVGGLHPDFGLGYYTGMLSGLRDALPKVHVQAFTAVEIAHIAKQAGMSISDTLATLRDAGLGSMPGGGAEVFSPRVRGLLCPEKMTAEDWLSVMKTAHRLGIRSNATMLYGHIETNEELVDHILRIRELQDETGGFLTFIPLKFHPANTNIAVDVKPTTSLEDLRLYSVSRLMLDNVEHLKVFWIMLGLKLAQVALSYGADDLDGTVVQEKIAHRAGAATPQGITTDELIGLIEETGTVPTERDTLYNRVIRDETGDFTISER